MHLYRAHIQLFSILKAWRIKHCFTKAVFHYLYAREWVSWGDVEGWTPDEQFLRKIGYVISGGNVPIWMLANHLLKVLEGQKRPLKGSYLLFCVCVFHPLLVLFHGSIGNKSVETEWIQRINKPLGSLQDLPTGGSTVNSQLLVFMLPCSCLSLSVEGIHCRERSNRYR